MAQSGRFSLALRILCVLAEEPERRQTSTEIADAVGTGPVMVRRLFGVLHRAGFIVQKKGPQGGARLKHPAKSIGLGDILLSVDSQWLILADPSLDPALLKVRREAVATMNETTLATLVKKRRKATTEG